MPPRPTSRMMRKSPRGSPEAPHHRRRRAERLGVAGPRQVGQRRTAGSRRRSASACSGWSARPAVQSTRVAGLDGGDQLVDQLGRRPRPGSRECTTVSGHASSSRPSRARSRSNGPQHAALRTAPALCRAPPPISAVSACLQEAEHQHLAVRAPPAGRGRPAPGRRRSRRTAASAGSCRRRAVGRPTPGPTRPATAARSSRPTLRRPARRAGGEVVEPARSASRRSHG